MILLIDNYDSFVYNIARYLRLAGKATRVVRSDAITTLECERLAPEAIVLSPGPHRPEDAGCCVEVVQRLGGLIPILGICLGHQCIATAYGGQVIRTPPFHGIASPIRHDGTGVFAESAKQFHVGRYHSLAVQEEDLPRSLQINAWTIEPSDQRTVIMGIADHARCVHGIQFHPESLLTEHGSELLHTFFRLVDRHHRRLGEVNRDPLHVDLAHPTSPVVWTRHRFTQTDTFPKDSTPSTWRKDVPFPLVSISTERTRTRPQRDPPT